MIPLLALLLLFPGSLKLCSFFFFSLFFFLLRLGKFYWSTLKFMDSIIYHVLLYCWAILWVFFSFFFWGGILYFYTVISIWLFFVTSTFCWIFFICFQRIYNCLWDHFYDGCFKVLVRSFQHLIHLSVAPYWLSFSCRLWFPWFLVWWVILLLLYPEHFIRLWILFNLFFSFFFFSSHCSKRLDGCVCLASPSMPAKIGHPLYCLVSSEWGY